MDLYDLGAAGAVAVVLLFFSVIGFFKGFFRFLLAILCLTAACYAGYWTHENALDLAGSVAQKAPHWMSLFLGITTGVISYFACRYLCQFLIDPFNSSKAGRRFGFGMPAALISLCVGITAIWLILAAIRFGGSSAELKQFQQSVYSDHSQSSQASQVEELKTPLLIKARTMLDESKLGSWHLLIDPFYSPEKMALCKTLILYHHDPSRILMLKIHDLQDLLNHPSFAQLAHREQIKVCASSQKAGQLFASPLVRQALTDLEFQQIVKKSDQLKEFIGLSQAHSTTSDPPSEIKKSGT